MDLFAPVQLRSFHMVDSAEISREGSFRPDLGEELGESIFPV